MNKLITLSLLLINTGLFAANPDYKAFLGTNEVIVTTNTSTGKIVIGPAIPISQTASNAAQNVSNNTSNALQTIIVANDTTTSNGVMSQVMTASNNLLTTIVANDTVTSNGVATLLVANDTATSNALRTLLVANDTVTSNGVLAAEAVNNILTSNGVVALISGNSATNSLFQTNGANVGSAGTLNFTANTITGAVANGVATLGVSGFAPSPVGRNAYRRWMRATVGSSGSYQTLGFTPSPQGTATYIVSTTNSWSALQTASAASSNSNSGFACAGSLPLFPGFNNYFCFYFRLGETNAGRRTWVGLGSTSMITVSTNDAPPHSYAAFRYSDGTPALSGSSDTNWMFITSNAGVGETNNTGVLVTTNNVKLEILEDSTNHKWYGFINGVRVATNSVNIPVVALEPGFISKTMNGNATTVYIYDLYGERD